LLDEWCDVGEPRSQSDSPVNTRIVSGGDLHAAVVVIEDRWIDFAVDHLVGEGHFFDLFAEDGRIAAILECLALFRRLLVAVFELLALSVQVVLLGDGDVASGCLF